VTHLAGAAEKADVEVVPRENLVRGYTRKESLELRHGGVERYGGPERGDNSLGTGLLEGRMQPLEVALGTVHF